MQGNRSDGQGFNHSGEFIEGPNPRIQGHHNEQHSNINFYNQNESLKVAGRQHENPYQPGANVINVQQTNQPQIIQTDNTLIVNNPPPNVIIINQTQTAKPDPVWTRQERIGCCCISVGNQSFCCTFLCMDALCRCVQNANLCCYCQNQDCIYCCIHQACRTCCFQKEMCECMLECCKHMPICLLIDCLKGCECLQNCNICETLRECNIGEHICNLICCLFR